MLDRTTHRNRRRERPVVVGFRMSKAKHDELIDLLVPFMQEAQPTAFAWEGPGRHALRQRLCLKGWRWSHADMEASAVVHGALDVVGAKRPLWIEGQMGYCESGFLRDEHCWNCGSPLPEQRKKFCSNHCRFVASQSLHGYQLAG